MSANTTWNYTAGSLSGSGEVSRAGKCWGIAITNASTTDDATFTINGGDTITLRAGRGLAVNPKGKLFDATVACLSGDIDVVIEVIQ